MKTTLTAIALILCVFVCEAQNDMISLKSGKNIKKCSIFGVDSTNNTLTYGFMGSYDQYKIPLSSIRSYLKDGVYHAVVIKSTEKKQDIVNQNNDALEQDSDEGIATYQPLQASPGRKLQLYANKAQIGVGLMFVGPLVCASALLVEYDRTSVETRKRSENSRRNIIITGALVSVAGYYLLFTSFNQVREAGIRLDRKSKARLDVTQNGVGIVVPIQ